MTGPDINGTSLTTLLHNTCMEVSQDNLLPNVLYALLLQDLHLVIPSIISFIHTVLPALRARCVVY